MREGGWSHVVPSNPAFVPILPNPTILRYKRKWLRLLMSFFCLFTRVEMVSPGYNSLTTNIFPNRRQLIRYLIQATSSPINIHFPNFGEVSCHQFDRNSGEGTYTVLEHKRFVCYIQYWFCRPHRIKWMYLVRYDFSHWSLPALQGETRIYRREKAIVVEQERPIRQ